MNTVTEEPSIEVQPHFDDGGFSAATAHRIVELFERISEIQAENGVTPTEVSEELTPELVAVEGFVHDALYKEDVLKTEARLRRDLEAAQGLLELRETWVHDNGLNRLIAEDQARDLRAYRERGDSNAFRQFNTRAANAANDQRNLEESRAKVKSLSASLADHLSQHPAIYGEQEA